MNGGLPTRDSLTVVFLFVAETGSSGVSIINIPFRFRAGHRQWNPGRYVLELVDEGVLGLRAMDTSVSAKCTMVRVEASSPSRKGTLVFVEQNSSYVLTKAFWPNDPNLVQRRLVNETLESLAQ